MIRRRRLLGSLSSRPLQASKLIGIVLGLVFGIGGFIRAITTGSVVDNPLLAGEQFSTLVFVPVGLALIGIVLAETAVTGWRIVRSDDSVRTQARGRLGYVFVRTLEATIAVVGVLFVFLTAPPLFAYSTPAPIGVSLLFGLTAVGGGTLVASLVRSATELWYF